MEFLYLCINKHKIHEKYEGIATMMFHELEILHPGESIVNKTVDAILNKKGNPRK